MITISCSFREKMKRFLLFCRALIILVSIYLSCVSSSILAESSSEKSILLEFKASVSDPSGILSSWDSNSSDYCSYWHGVSCDSDFRVSSLNISGATDYEEEGKSKHFSYPKLSLFPYHHGFGIRRICAPGNRKLVGKISPAIGKLTELRVLSLPCHDFRGEIPREILGMEKLKVLDLNANSLNGELPDRFAGLRGLKIFDLGFNRIYGEIPLSFSKCSHLEVLNLAGNRFNGSLPKSLAKFKSLLILDLSGNKFQGRIPTEISRLKYLKYLSLASNNLSSLIPSSFIQLCFLEVLNVSSNSLSGEIPQGLALLRKLTALHLDNNKLSGKIPSGLVNSISISSFCVSFNNLSESFPLNNVVKKSCGSVILGRGLSFYSRRFLSRKLSSLDSSSSTVKDSSQSKKLNSIEVVSIVSASAIMMVLLALIILFFYTRKLAPRSNIRVPESREITVFSDIGVPLTYDIIVRATRNFSTANCIGNGGFGATYKAEISPGNLVAVKRLAIGRCQGVQQFHAEIQTLERVRHRNLVTLIGYHASEDEMFLIYNFLPGGNLENFIQERSTRAVDWKILHKIALDIAQALSYLHNQCNPRVLHRDIKPSNILLDNEFNAYLSDFGLSRLIGASETHVTTGVAGTFGYVAPEYAMTCRVSDKVDVYSYGVVLLELISDKKALDPSFSSHANGFNIVSWAHIQLQAGRAKEVFTGGLWETGPHGHLVETLHLAIMCTDETLSRRPTMKQVVHTLKRIKLGSS